MDRIVILGFYGIYYGVLVSVTKDVFIFNWPNTIIIWYMLYLIAVPIVIRASKY
jgi:hypothetical protein